LNLVVSERNLFLKTSSSHRSFETVSSDIEYSFVRLLEKELEFVRNLSAAIRDISLAFDFNVLDAYRAIDTLRIDNINTESIRKFLVRNYITPSEQDVLAIFKRIDIDRDYRITYTEFKNLFSSYSSGYTVSNSTFSKTQYSPQRTNLYCSPRRCYSPHRTLYSPPKTRTLYSPLRSRGNDSLGESQGKLTSSPLRTRTYEVLSRSPKRVESPLRSSKNVLNQTLSNENNLNTSKINSETITRSSSLEDDLLLNYIKDLISIENNIESLKAEVAIKSDFNMEDAFTIFEKYNKGYISEIDFKDGLNSYFGLFPLLEEISVLFKRYDNESNRALSYGDFFNMLAPFTQEFRRLVENRIYPNSTLIGDPFSASTKYAVKDLIGRIINYEQSLELSRRKFKNLISFNSKKAFELIGGYASNYFSEKDVSTKLNKNISSHII
jgi:Ca2+-binding EF-hand superfamily protein